MGTSDPHDPKEKKKWVKDNGWMADGQILNKTLVQCVSALDMCWRPVFTM